MEGGLNVRPVILGLLFLIIGLAGISCGGKSEKKESGCGPMSYPQIVKTDVAWVVLEWNCQPYAYGSGFLVDKEKGAFFTNKHVSNMFDALGKGSHKIFFNGKVYNAEVVQTPPLADVALVRITDEFDSSEFPEPGKFSDEKPKLGDMLFIEGMHPHWHWVREYDKIEGYEYSVIPIYKDYYDLGTRNLEREREVVFEMFWSEVTEVDKPIEIGGQGSGLVQGARDMTNRYIEVKTYKDHKFPFGGLSGTVVRNTKGETVGVFTAGPKEEYDPDSVEKIGEDGFSIKRVFKTAYITPITAVKDLMQYLK